MTIDLDRPSAVDAGPATGAEQVLAETLAETAGLEPVAVDSHFFDDLGLDSLMIAHFCARVRKGGRVASISVKDCYQHPTIRSLAASLPAGAPVDLEREPADVVSAARRTAAPAGSRAHIVCGALQLLVFVAYASIAGVAFSAGYEWISAAPGLVDAYVRSVAFGAATRL